MFISEGLLVSLPATLLFCFLLVPSVARRVFSSFSCDSFGYDDRYGVRRFYLHTDHSVRCTDPLQTSPEHEQIKLVSGFLIAIWPVGVPLLFAGLLIASRRSRLLRLLLPSPRTISSTTPPS